MLDKYKKVIYPIPQHTNEINIQALEEINRHNNQPDYKMAWEEYVSYAKCNEFSDVLEHLKKLEQKYNLGGE